MKNTSLNNIIINKINNTEIISQSSDKLPNENILYNNKNSKFSTKNNLLNLKEILNNEELNDLSYYEALKLDKRSYFHYYFSLLKKKHIILFAFLPNNDYNLVSIKICLFLISFSLYFSINTFFFTDDTMHNIYIENGSYIIINHIPKIIYSSIISLTIQQILRLLSLSENNIIKIKNENTLLLAREKSINTYKFLIIKFVLFFILGFSLMAFFWYIITCFCSVYINTQIILIKNTFMSYGLSMLYPFILYLLPGIFRIYSLRSKEYNKECIYKVGTFISFF